jgi:hypothetical protein
MTPSIPVSTVAWSPCHRLIASRFPTVGLYDQVASPEDLEVVLAIEALTDPQARQELGRLRLVPPEARVTGPGATLIMSAFTHLNPLGSRFSDGSWGVYYAGESFETALAEVGHHRAAFLARTAEPAIDIDLRWIQADVVEKLHDLRGWRAARPEIHDPAYYGAGQALARTLRAQGSAGLVYESVRRPQGQCLAIFRPKALSNARAAGHVGLHWDGRAITHWFEKGAPHVV